MRADELIAKYVQGERDFRGLNLNGLCFKGKNLADANFSKSSIKSTNFSYANLQNCQFHNVKTGIRSSSLILLIVICCCFLIISGLFFFVVTISELYIFSSTSFTLIVIGVFSLIVDLFLLFILPFYLIKNYWLRLVTIPFITGLTGAIIGAFAGKITIPVSLTLAFISGITGVIIGLLIILMAMTIILIAIILNLWTSFLFILIPIFSGFIITSIFAFAQIYTLSISLAVIFISFLLSWFALQGNIRYSFLLKLSEAIACYLGTNFHHANLANAEFNRTLIKNVDFRKANLSGINLENIDKIKFTLT